nr:MAG TPA: hypothetical protein [Caudoviricetes sp.]DAW83488.1 MAG TPA: hypothetical protein [Caudoviricetes sp.]
MYTALSCRPYKPIPLVRSFLLVARACHLKQYQGKALK